jgi:hypothetical protein
MTSLPSNPKGLLVLPWLWIGLGAAFCFILGSFIKELAHANGPDTGGALLLLPMTVAVYPVGLFWIGVGLLLLFDHGWARGVATFAAIGLLIFAGFFIYVPAAIPVGLVIAAIPVATLVILRSPAAKAYREAKVSAQQVRLERIRRREEVPAVVPILSCAWIAAGFLFLFSWPLSYAVFRTFPSAAPEENQRLFAYLIGAASIPFGAIMFLMGRDFKKPRPSASRSARILLLFGWAGLIFDALAFPSVAVVSSIAFFYIASWMALGQESFKSYCTAS